MALNVDTYRVDSSGDSPQAGDEKKEPPMSEEYIERVNVDLENLVYEDAEHEPDLHLRTWIALAAMWLYNLAIVFALNSPSAVVCRYLHYLCHIGSLIMLADLIYRGEPPCARCSDLGCQRTHASTSRSSTSFILSVGRFSSPQTHHGWCNLYFLHWSGDSSWLAEYL